MKTLSPGLADHLAAGVTTLCHCWRLERKDGTVLGFTDHDRDLSFDGVTFEAASGLEASEAVSAAGFAVGGLDVAGGLRSDRLTEDDLAAGLYDHAEVRLWLVNWAAPGERQLLRVGHIGEVTREDAGFRAEVRGLAALLDQPQGRLFRHDCDADLGDARCGIDLTAAAYRGTGTVIAGEGGRRFTASGLGSFEAGWFERDRLVWTGGANAGAAAEVRLHRLADGVATLELWQPAFRAIAAGDGFTVTAGCDKLFSTCCDRFANAVNFRGFPHMPGNDFALSYPRDDEEHDGGPVVL